MSEISPLESAARALHAHYVADRIRMGVKPTDLPAWDDLGQDGKYLFFYRARAVIVAIRDVDAGSPAVLVAGKRSLFSCSEDPELEDARGCWHAMIDAILAPPLPSRREDEG